MRSVGLGVVCLLFDSALGHLEAQPATAAAQAAGVLHRIAVVRPRDDSIGRIESFIRDRDGISGERPSEGFQYRLTVDASGRVVATCFHERNLQSGGWQQGVGELSGQRVSVKWTDGTKKDSLVSAGVGPVALYVPAVLASIEQLIRSTSLLVGDSVRVLMANFRYGDTVTGVVSRLSADSFRVLNPRHADVRVRVSEQREILGGTMIARPSRPGPINPNLVWRLVRLPDVAADTSSARLRALSCISPRSPNAMR